MKCGLERYFTRCEWMIFLISFKLLAWEYVLFQSIQAGTLTKVYIINTHNFYIPKLYKEIFFAQSVNHFTRNLTDQIRNKTMCQIRKGDWAPSLDFVLFSLILLWNIDFSQLTIRWKDLLIIWDNIYRFLSDLRHQIEAEWSSWHSSPNQTF